jgi:hypothetical protein
VNTGLPYRPPCDGWNRTRRAGGCFQHWRYREAHFPVYSNDTRDGDGNVPWEGSMHWDADGDELYRQDCATGTGRKEFSYNCLTLMPDRTKNLAICQKKGWKAVQACKYWHGRRPFTSWEDPNNQSSNIDATATTVRYRTYTKSIWWENKWVLCRDNGPATYATEGSSYTRTTTIDRLSGRATSSNYAVRHWCNYDGSSPPICPEQTDIDEEQYVGPPPCYNGGVDLMPYILEGGYWVNMEAFLDWLQNPSGPDTGWEVTPEQRNACLKQQGPTAASYSLNCGPANPNDDSNIYFKLNVSVSLSGEYTAAQLRKDVDDLLATWDLTDDAVYPWRYDMALTKCPLVTRREVQDARSPDGLWDENDPEDPEDYIVDQPVPGYIDGSIYGAPFEDGYPLVITEDTVAENFHEDDIEDSEIQLPETAHHIDSAKRYDAGNVLCATGVEGTDWTFDNDCQKLKLTPNSQSYTNPLLPVNAGDYIEITYDRKLDEIGGLYDPFIGKWSGLGTGAGGENIPHSAVQWTPSNMRTLLPPGAWLRTIGGALWAQKYAETKMPWKSQNWFGPCGESRDADYHSETCWPSAWPIEGDRGCSAAVDGAKIKVTLDSAALWLRERDKVDFTNADGEVTEANVEVTDIEGSGDGAGPGMWFKFSGSLPTGTRVKSHGAPGFWWFDRDGKGDFMKNEWGFNYRDIVSDATLRKKQEDYYGMPREVNKHTCQTKCIKFDRCAPAVLCFSPNADIDKFDNGITYPFDSFESFVPDTKFGSLWIGNFRQIMCDLWYEPSEDPNDKMDAGNCKADVPDATIPHYPPVEARATTPQAWLTGDTAPVPSTVYVTHNSTGPTVAFALRGGEYRLFLELEDLDNTGTYADVAVQIPKTDMVLPPTTPWQPWRLWSAMQSCICAEGVWFEDYEDMLPIWVCGEPEPICSGHYPA